ncbi:hypothetical protein ACE6H2_026592 [Prunus campanulata]
MAPTVQHALAHVFDLIVSLVYSLGSPKIEDWELRPLAKGAGLELVLQNLQQDTEVETSRAGFSWTVLVV